MEAYAQLLSYAIPGFVLLIIIEEIAARIMGRKVNRALDTISSLTSGMTNTLKSLLGLAVVIVSYDWMLGHLAIFDIKSSVWLFGLAFIGHDFASYWSHRWNHEINLFWNRHIVHHSSEEFNLSCALRQSISAVFGVYFFLYIPMAIVGIPTGIVALVGGLHLFAQFWYHTRLIKDMGFLENIIVTPAHHRVHHAINPEYIDKNFAAIFIVWDKLFGTFQAEIDGIPAVYGTKTPAATWNPITINFMHLWMLIKDAWRTESWMDKLTLWFRPTGYRPADLIDKYPVPVVDDVYNRPKYDTGGNNYFIAWSWFQLVVHNVLIYFMMAAIADFSYENLFIYSSFLAISIIAYTTLMDRHIMAIPFEVAKTFFGCIIIYQTGGWFGLEAVLPIATWLVLAYLMISLVVTVYFSINKNLELSVRPDHKTLA